MLHLREFRLRTFKNHYDYGAHSSASAQANAQQYIAQRLDAAKHDGGQIAYLRNACQLANKRLSRYNKLFFWMVYRGGRIMLIYYDNYI